MKPRAGRLLFWTLLIVAGAMVVLLYFLRERASRRLSSAIEPPAAASPIQGAPATVTWMMANDIDGSLLEQQRTLPLPEESSARARAMLNQLLAAYAKPGSTHPIAPSPGVDTVFLLPLPKPTSSTPSGTPQGTLAIVSLSGAFAATHPSGIAPETMTLLSLIATLHANMPAIAEVRFLVDGAPRATLAGHADLTHTYLASSSAAPVPETATPANSQADSSGARP